MLVYKFIPRFTARVVGFNVVAGVYRAGGVASGTQSGAVEANNDFADLGDVFSAGIEIVLPELALSETEQVFISSHNIQEV